MFAAFFTLCFSYGNFNAHYFGWIPPNVYWLCVSWVTYYLVPRLPDQEKPPPHTCGQVHDILDFYHASLFRDEMNVFGIGKQGNTHLRPKGRTMVDYIIVHKYSLLPCGRVLSFHSLYISFGHITCFGQENMSRNEKPYIILSLHLKNGFSISWCSRTKYTSNRLDHELGRRYNAIKK